MKAARVGKDLTQEDLAQQVDISRQTISAIEKGNYNPSVNLCIKICQALDKTLDDLFGRRSKQYGKRKRAESTISKRKAKSCR